MTAANITPYDFQHQLDTHHGRVQEVRRILTKLSMFKVLIECRRSIKTDQIVRLHVEDAKYAPQPSPSFQIPRSILTNIGHHLADDI